MTQKLRVLVVFALIAGSSSASYAESPNPPQFIQGSIQHTFYEGAMDDLLTAGLGKTGLQGAAPGFFDPLNPTAAELRRRAIYNNYRALVDMFTSGGYGVFYGPNIDLNGNNTLGEGKIAGDEFLAYADDGTGRKNVTLMVQVPTTFDPANACIVTATSSGSRGIYGAVATAGEWGLKRGCAVAYTDKGTGTGAHDLQANTVNLIDGTRSDAAVAGAASNFTADITEGERAAFNTATPNRFAFKHAHSEQNPEADWGVHTLQAVEFAFHLLNQKGIGKFHKNNTIVIASSVSNGGGAALQAAEIDTEGLIDGVAVSEPNVNPTPTESLFSIVQGTNPPVTNHSKSLLDYITLINLFQPCASLAPANAGAPFNFVLTPLATNRCTSLKEKGLLTATTVADQATEAQQIINSHGILTEQNILQPSHYFLSVPQSIAVTYANAYGRFSVLDNLCGFSFGATDSIGDPAPLAAATLARIFSDSNGIPPTPAGGVNLINNLSVGSPKLDGVSTSPSTNKQDLNIDGAICLRNLAVGMDIVTGQPLTGDMLDKHQRIMEGIAAIRATADLHHHHHPTVIVTGRDDAILPPNHASRAYFGLNKSVEAHKSRLQYYEVTHAQHLDTLNAQAGFNSRYIPLHVYFIQAMNLMYDHLKNGTPLPPSQVVRTTQRAVVGGVLQPLTSANVPPISPTPANDALITFSNQTVFIPE